MGVGTQIPIRLTAQSVDIVAQADQAGQAGENKKPPKIAIVAYSGGLMSVAHFGLVAFDLQGLKSDESAGRVAILADHDASLGGVLGQGQSRIEDGKLWVEGELVARSQAASRVMELAKAGFVFQASVGAEPIKQRRVSGGEQLTLNGRSITAPEGGFTLISEARLREVSVVALGADARTGVKIAASKPSDPQLDVERIRAEERMRLAGIEKIVGELDQWGQARREMAALRAKAIEGELSLEQLSGEALRIMRASRPQSTCAFLRSGYDAPPDAQAITAALFIRLGREGLGERFLGAQAMERGKSLGTTHLLDLCRASLVADGVSIPSSRQELVRAALTTFSLPAALGDAAHKLLIEAYDETPATWPSFCGVRSVSDFKPHQGIRPTFTGPLQKVAPGGELKHGGVSEAVYPYQIDTFGKLLAVDRRDLINDDLGVFDDSARALGQAARRKVSDLTVQTLLSEEGAFFKTEHGNFLSGAGSALSHASFGQALTLLHSQRDEEGNDLDLKAATLMVPPGLEIRAREILESETMERDVDRPTKNVLRHAARLEVEPRLSNHVRFAAKASPNHWFVFAAPSACPMVVAFLNGLSKPVVEFFGLETQPDRLAVSWRVYFDFGAALCDHRAAVKSQGQA